MSEMDSSVKKYKHRRAARLGITTLHDYDSVQTYRKRRAERLDEANKVATKAAEHGHISEQEEGK